MLQKKQMSSRNHTIYILLLSLLVLTIFVFLVYIGFSFYKTSIELRVFHKDYTLLKPSGLLGHGLGIIGTLLILIGIASYMLRKRSKKLMRFGLLKHWLEFHIFLCTLGPIMILFHTSFKFGGIVSMSFWSMVLVFISGIIGRYIYIQIPRTIEGRELSLVEVKALRSDVQSVLIKEHRLDEKSVELILKSVNSSIEIYHSNFVKDFISKKIENHNSLSRVKKMLKEHQLSAKESKQILGLLKTELSINRKIKRLDFMKNLFNYWHVAHLPFAIVMITVMLIHVIITISFGYKWIF